MKKNITFKLSEQGLTFIKEYAVKELIITSKIDDDIMDKIFKFAVDCELNMIDEQGKDKEFNYPEKERDILGDEFVSEVSGNYGKNINIDLNDLNSRLNLE